MSTLALARILVPTDGSECSRRAAEYAVLLARCFGAEVCFVHAVDEKVLRELRRHGAPSDREEDARRLRESGRAQLHDLARLAAGQGLAHREEVLEGDPCNAICDAAERLRADLIVMGKIGQGGARRIVMGSVTRRVAESANRPVLIVGENP